MPQAWGRHNFKQASPNVHKGVTVEWVFPVPHANHLLGQVVGVMVKRMIEKVGTFRGRAWFRQRATCEGVSWFSRHVRKGTHM